MAGDPPSRREHTLITLFRDAGRVLTEELVRRLAARGHPGIRVAHGQVFENLDPEGTRLTALAERAQLTHPAMSELVSGLVRLGYVERVADARDGRVRLVRPTAAGNALQRVALVEIAELERTWLNRLDPDGAAGLRAALTRLVTQRR